jgi:hypothetical protein
LIRACHGSVDQERLGFGSGPSDHLKHHALLRAVVAGPSPLELAFGGRPSRAIDRGARNAPSLGRGPSLGPRPSSSDPNSGELVGFGGASPANPLIGGWAAPSRELAQPPRPLWGLPVSRSGGFWARPFR